MAVRFALGVIFSFVFLIAISEMAVVHADNKTCRAECKASVPACKKKCTSKSSKPLVDACKRQCDAQKKACYRTCG